MALPDLRGLLDQDLQLPIGGTTYRVPAPTAKIGLRLQLMRDAASMKAAGLELSSEDVKLLVVADDDEKSFYRLSLGSAYQEMLDGGVLLPELKAAAAAAFIYWTAVNGHGQEDLEVFWAAQADPHRALTEQQTKTPHDTGSTPTAKASTTKRPASMSGTKASRKASGKKAPRALRSAS